MNSSKAKEIFVSLVDRVPPDQWSEQADEACEGDALLRKRVEALLAAHADPDSHLDAPSLRVTQTVQGTRPIAEQPGAQIGPYKLLQQIGEGGMGVVYMAEQTEPVERRVALKIIKPGMDSRQVIARFEAERQALALMDHPNIAKVLDAAATESGRPYFVMELVKGIACTKYCDDKHLTLRERLELFIPVCLAVQHAHQKGIIHRDLKPSNVLVAQYDGQPVPKVIDFGVAKATSQKLTEKTMFTQFGQVVGTLEYMSPEQAEVNQLDIDTRSDVYSLGVLLYELLTGATPFDRARLRSAAFDEMLRIIREEEPPRPSMRLSTIDSLPAVAANRQIEPRKLATLVRGELDWIVMKALEKDRSRRYDTANHLAADLDRYLRDQAVEACPPSNAYRMRKFIRRNKARIRNLSAFALVLAVIAIVSLRQVQRHRVANDRRRAETLVEDVLAAPKEAVRHAIPNLEPLEKHSVEILRQMMENETDPGRHSRAAVVLSEFRQVAPKLMVDSIEAADVGTCDYFVRALSDPVEDGIVLLKEKVAEAEVRKAWQHKARLAVVALHLGDVSVAQDMCQQLYPDPIQRTLFIDTLDGWHDDLSTLREFVEEAPRRDGWRSGICLALGSVQNPRQETKAAWGPLLVDWYLAEPEAATHSAAGWALKQWKLELPAIPATEQPAENFAWHLTSTGLTMIRVPAGQFVRESWSKGQPTGQKQTVRITRDFLLSDCETTLNLFRRFLDDAKYGGDKPAAWHDVDEEIASTPAHPVQQLCWVDAAMFCNWLSWKEGLTPRYTLTPRSAAENALLQRSPDAIPQGYTVQSIKAADGYRLPTEAEWELACRAGTTTTFASGDDLTLVGRYCVSGVNSGERSEEVGRRMCNAWGLYNMQGNVWELCENRGYVSFLGGDYVEDPTGPTTGGNLINRGGGWFGPIQGCRSSRRKFMSPERRSFMVGFRVAR